MQGQSLSDASTNSLIGIGASKGVNKVEVLDKSSQDVVSTFLTERAAKKKDELLKSREDKNKEGKK